MHSVYRNLVCTRLTAKISLLINSLLILSVKDTFHTKKHVTYADLLSHKIYCNSHEGPIKHVLK